MYALVTRDVPFVLTGSIRDDGPLPEVITDTLAAQDAMKKHTTKATMAILVATALHAIATGNMLPAFVMNGDGTFDVTVGFKVGGTSGLSSTFNPSGCSSITVTGGIITAKSGC